MEGAGGGPERDSVGGGPGEAADERRALAEGALDLVEMVLVRLRAQGVTVDPEELRGYGRQGLWEAAERFEPERGHEFRQFAYLRVQGAMIDGLRKMGNWSRRGYERVRLLRAANASRGAAFEETPAPSRLSSDQADELLRKHMAQMATAAVVGTFVEAAFEGEELVGRDMGLSAEELVGRREEVEVIRRAVDQLPEEEAEVVRRFYLQGQALDEIAQAWGCSRSWISRVHTRAVRRLGVRLRSMR
ncbi:MAG TPA: sigma-70 family RNA polymerase sigma factor [Polyangiaceae bacterium]|nr:sigma-70 family RNA polymerase sigma factor [Polyangiaceae bacterium]